MARSGQELDLRLVKVNIEVNGVIKSYQDLNIRATGMRYANANQNEAEITIYNLDKTTQDYILTQTSPYNLNRSPKSISLEAGRQSYGTALIYKGNVVSSKPTQPPDIGIVMKCLTGNFYKGSIVSNVFPGTVPLSTIVKKIASDINLKPVFQTQDRNISNFTYTGAALKQIEQLAALGNINAFADNASLIVKTIGLPRSGIVKILSAQTGMIGIPEITEQGVKVKFLIDNKTELGAGLQIDSKVYPAVNGKYIIYKLGFEITNRDVPFYWIAEAIRQL